MTEEHLTTPQPTAVPDDEDLETKIQRWRADRDRRYDAIRRDSRAVYKAMERWGTVSSPEAWDEIQQKADEQHLSGRFLIEQLGAESYLYPELMAVLWQIRQRLIAQYDARDPASEMLVDMAIVAYDNGLRVQGWIGSASLWTEHELFGQESPTAKLKQQYGYTVEGLKVEDLVQRLVEQLFPLADRCNRMLIRNLRALRELKRPLLPSVAIQQAGQVNVGAQQVNAAMQGEAPGSP